MSADHWPEISVVIPTYRRTDALRATLAGLAQVDVPQDRWELVVVDDGDDDGVATVLNDLRPRLPRLTAVRQANSGVATARNNGARAARGRLLVFLDDDMLVGSDHLRQHLSAQERHGACLVNGHWEFAADVREELQRTPFGRFRIGVEQWVKEGIAMTPLAGGDFTPAGVTAANLGIPAEIFWSIGGFDESFPFAGYEDQEFSRRAARLGHPFVYCPQLQLGHNDQRITLRQFGERQRQGALTAMYLVQSEPAAAAGLPLVLENLPRRRSEALRTSAKKGAKSVLSTPPMLGALHRMIDAWERLRPQSKLLPRLYWGVCGLYIYRGVRDGLDALPELRATLVGT